MDCRKGKKHFQPNPPPPDMISIFSGQFVKSKARPLIVIEFNLQPIQKEIQRDYNVQTSIRLYRRRQELKLLHKTHLQ